MCMLFISRMQTFIVIYVAQQLRMISFNKIRSRLRLYYRHKTNPPLKSFHHKKKFMFTPALFRTVDPSRERLNPLVRFIWTQSQTAGVNWIKQLFCLGGLVLGRLQVNSGAVRIVFMGHFLCCWLEKLVSCGQQNEGNKYGVMMNTDAFCQSVSLIRARRLLRYLLLTADGLIRNPCIMNLFSICCSTVWSCVLSISLCQHASQVETIMKTIGWCSSSSRRNCEGFYNWPIIEQHFANMTYVYTL